MDLGKRYFGKVYMQEALTAMTSPQYGYVYVNKDTGAIEQPPYSAIFANLIDLSELDNSYRTWAGSQKIKLPYDEDLGVEQLMCEFAKEHKIKLPKYKSSKEFEKAAMTFKGEVSRRNLEDEWGDVYMLHLHDRMAEWFCKKKISFIDDYAPDYLATLEKYAYVFSVSYKAGCYRHIKIGSLMPLVDLAEAILEAFEFENDHAHAFFMSNRLWDKESEFVSYELEESVRITDYAYLADFHFDKGDTFKFLFDFGDCWEFNVKFLRRIDEYYEDFEVIRSVGESPEQYPNWDEEDWDEE